MVRLTLHAKFIQWVDVYLNKCHECRLQSYMALLLSLSSHSVIQRSHTHTDTLTDAHTDAGINALTDTHTNAHTDAHTDAHTNAHTGALSDTHTNARTCGIFRNPNT